MVDKVVRLHHDWYMSNSFNPSCTPKREDITLVLRNFNFPMPNAMKSPTKPTVQFNTQVITNTNSSTQKTLTNLNTNSTVRTNTTSSSDAKPDSEDEMGPDQRIPGYVDFTNFYKSLEKARKDGTVPSWLT